MQAPHDVVESATGTNLVTIQLNDVGMDDEGMYNVNISLEFRGTVIVAFQEFNLRRFPLNIRAIKTKIKLPKRSHGMVTF